MSKNTLRSTSSGINFGDIVYVLFKHKWKIALTTLLALGAAAVYYFKAPPPFVSEAKLMIIYVKDSNAIDQVETTASTSNSRSNDTVIKSEMEILTSWDLATGVVLGMRDDSLAAKPKSDPVTPEVGAKSNESKPLDTNLGGTKAGAPEVPTPFSSTPSETVSGAGGDTAAARPEAIPSTTGNADRDTLGTTFPNPVARPVAPPGEAPPPRTEITETDAIKNAERVGQILEWLRDAHPDGSIASAIASNLSVGAEKGGNVIRVSFAHEHPDVPTYVLDKIVQHYYAKHRAIHRSAQSLETIQRRKEESSTKLAEIERKLRNHKGSTLSLADLTALYDADLSKARAELAAAETALAEQMAWVKEVRKYVSGVAGASTDSETESKALPENESVAPSETETRTASRASSDSASESPTTPDPGIVKNYKELLEKIAVLQTNRNNRLKIFTPGSEEIKSYESWIKPLEAQRVEMEKRYPYLVATAATATTKAGSSMDLPGELGKLASISARVTAIQPRVVALESRKTALDNNASVISELERKRDVEMKNFEHLSTSYVKAEADTMVPTTQMPGIGIVQEPTPAARDVKKRNQILAAIAGGGPVLGISLVLLFGLLLNRTVKRSPELEESMGLPVMMTVPYFSRRQRLRACLPMGTSKPTRLLKDSESAKAPWQPHHFIRPFAEAIRDRLSMQFEAAGHYKKPKLIAVTGYNGGAGTSTLAAGLASSMSETGEGKVLLVDMTGSHGEAHPFFDGQPAISLSKALRLRHGSGSRGASNESNGAAHSDSGTNGGHTHDIAKSGRENLFLARADAPLGGAATARLRRMMPDLKASDFDYVIFDMPSLGQTKPTATMGGLMDKVLVIVEAEQNTRCEVRRGYRDLVDSGSNVSMVFNKARFHGPRGLAGSI
jgi:polysaccharide biosynthesis transport protein